MTRPAAAPHVSPVLQTIDSVVQERALVFGSLPPSGRDIDLLVRPADSTAIASRLGKDGFTAWHGRWVKFRGCSVWIIDLVPASGLSLPSVELGALFSEGTVLKALTNVVEPAPHHTLLILAKKLARQRGALATKHRRRIDRAVAIDPRAWEVASKRAPLWRAQRSLRRLESRYGGTAAALKWRVRPRRPRRTRVIALSGIDRSGRSTQAHFLRDTLDRLGFDSVLERPFSGRIALGLGAAFALRSSTWRHLGRGRVIVYDRYALDVAVSLRERKKDTRRIGLQTRILRILSPATSCSYLLDVSADPHAVSIEGETDELAVEAELYRFESLSFRAQRLDAGTPAEELCEQLAIDVLRTLDRHPKITSLIRRLSHSRKA